MKKRLMSLMAIVLVLGLAACTERQVPEEEVVQAPETVAETAAETSEETEVVEEVTIPADGVYEGEPEGFHATTPVKVSVTVEGGTITAVEIIEHEESEGISDPAIEGVPAAIVENNSPNVDVVSGATYTSNGIMDAVRNALSQ